MKVIREFKTMSKRDKVITLVVFGAMFLFLAMMVINPAFATKMNSEATESIQGVLNDMIGIVGTVFQAVGVILAVYSVGQLVMAFKNEDADSKSRASTMLVVGICLIAIPSIVSGLELVDKIGK